MYNKKLHVKYQLTCFCSSRCSTFLTNFNQYFAPLFLKVDLNSGTK